MRGFFKVLGNVVCVVLIAIAAWTLVSIVFAILWQESELGWSIRRSTIEVIKMGFTPYMVVVAADMVLLALTNEK